MWVPSPSSINAQSRTASSRRISGLSAFSPCRRTELWPNLAIGIHAANQFVLNRRDESLSKPRREWKRVRDADIRSVCPVQATSVSRPGRRRRCRAGRVDVAEERGGCGSVLQIAQAPKAGIGVQNGWGSQSVDVMRHCVMSVGEFSEIVFLPLDEGLSGRERRPTTLRVPIRHR